ncbi:hypothetical protein [Metamycoplasma canadense]|uniref:Rho termination factor N-terminal domain-containing protein n=1 Tax=Metamycoplasma canadense TaxID=29554 RepID=A0A077LC75_9BACT|nr:hypothetical protein [Metamycoplasma canadense]BAP39704.1 hypothetical protein MCAN360_0628 [Metamycoplasma canadense]
MRGIDLNLYNSTQDLYEKNKKRFKIWWILFTTFLISIVVFFCAVFIEYAINKVSYINQYLILIGVEKVVDPEGAVNTFYTRNFITSISSLLISLAMVIWHSISLISAMKQKDYSRYSNWLSLIYSIVITVNIINLIFSSNRFKIESWNVYSILNIVITIFIIVGYFVCYLPCSKIIRLFKTLKMHIQLKQITSSPMNVFDSLFKENIQSPEISNPEDTNDIQKSNSKEDFTSLYKSKLETLDDKKLILMAEKLNIFGAKELSRHELIEKISSIFEEREKNQKEETKKNNEEKKSDD